MSGMNNIQSFMQEMANKTKQAEEEARFGSSKETNEVKESKSEESQPKVDVNKDDLIFSDVGTFDESTKEEEVNNKSFNEAKEVEESTKEVEKNDSAEENQENLESTINLEDLPFSDIPLDESTTEKEDKESATDASKETTEVKTEENTAKESVETKSDEVAEKSEQPEQKKKINIKSNKSGGKASETKAKISIKKKDDPRDKENTEKSSSLNKIKIVNNNKVKTKVDTVPPVPQSTQSTTENKNVDSKQESEHKPRLNAAGREIKVYKKDNSNSNNNYPKFSKNKEKYAEEDLMNPNLTEEERTFVKERLKEQEILAGVEAKIAQQNKLNQQREALEQKQAEVESNSCNNNNQDESSPVESSTNDSNDENSANIVVPTLETIPKDEYEVVEKCDIGQITEEEANKIDGEFIMKPSEAELEELYKISDTAINQKERWFEIVDMAWKSDVKSLSNKKFKNGKFRLDQNGHIEMLPDHETHGYSSKDLLKQQWRI